MVSEQVIFCNSITEPIFKKAIEDWHNKKEGEPHIIGWEGGEPVFSNDYFANTVAERHLPEDVDLDNLEIRKHDD